MASSTLPSNTGASTNTSSGGYLKSPDGTLFQWGKTTITTNSSTGNGYYPYGGLVTVTFPIPFVGDLPILLTNVQQNGAYWHSATSGSNQTLTTADFSIGGDTNNSAKPFNWIAIGRWK